MRLLIAGCGYLGTEVARRALAAGAEVHALRRSVRELPAGVRPLAADLADPSTLDLPRDIDAVAYTAAADARDDAAYLRAYPAGLRNLLEALRVSGNTTARVAFTSSTGVYAQVNGVWVDEDSAAERTHFTGARMLEAEAVLRDSKFRATSLRLGGLYGPGRTRLIESVRRGQASYASDSIEWINRIHRDDAARAVLHSFQLEAPAATLCVVDREPAPRREVLQWLANALGAPAPASAQQQRDPRTFTNKRVRSDRLLHSGFEFEYPTFRDGYAAVLAALDRDGSSE